MTTDITNKCCAFALTEDGINLECFGHVSAGRLNGGRPRQRLHQPSAVTTTLGTAVPLISGEMHVCANCSAIYWVDETRESK